MKTLLLALISIGINAVVHGQSVLFHENFDQPSWADSITIGKTVAGNPILPDTTSELSISANHSILLKGSQAGTQIFIQTKAFSTVGHDFIKLQFGHIAKLHQANFGFLELSTDSGLSWQPINSAQYRGKDPSFPITGYFNEASYNRTTGSLWKAGFPGVTPDNSWWQTELFDLTGIANDTNSPGGIMGYTNVMIRFSAQINSGITPGNASFAAGWFLDDIKVLGGACELFPPDLSFDFNPSFCYIANPTGVVPNVGNNYFFVGVQATDNRPLDTGIDSVTCYYRINGGLWQHNNMALQAGISSEYVGTINNVAAGDTVDYRIVGWDFSCPNISRLPEDSLDYYSFISTSFPGKCISGLCGADQLITNFPWVENFEGTEWVAGSGNGDNGFTHRGSMPVTPQGIWNIFPGIFSTMGWSVRTGATGTTNTGPSSDHTSGQGKYLYTEFSQNTSPTPISTWIETPCIDLRDSVIRGFEFYYHKYGAHVQNLVIDVDTGTSGTSYWNGFDLISGQTQLASDEPWKRHFFSLEKFIGKIIKVRFTSVANLGPLRDIGIDDLRIFEPPARDAAIGEIIEPATFPCGIPNGMTIKVNLQNQGSDTLKSLPVGFQFNSGPIVRDTINNLSMAMGDTLVYSFQNAGLSLIAGMNNLKVWVDIPGENNKLNDTTQLNWYNDTVPPIDQFPYFLDFESTTKIPGGDLTLNDPHWRDVTIGSRAGFKVVEGELTNFLEGPLSGLGRGKKALVLQNTKPGTPFVASFRSGCIDLSVLPDPLLTFVYYLKVGEILKIRVQEPGSGWQTIRTITGTSVPKANFLTEQVSLAAFDGIILLEFSIEGGASSDLTNALVIDNVIISNGSLIDLGLTSVSPQIRRLLAGSTVLPTFVVELLSVEHPLLYANTTINIDLVPSCDTTLPTYFGQTTLNVNFASRSLSRSFTGFSMNAPLQPGLYQATVSVQHPLDSLTFNDSIYFECLVYQSVSTPYLNDFEGCQKDFFTNGPMRQWEIDTVLTGLPTPSLAYVTNADRSLLTHDDSEKLIPPFFLGMDTLKDVELRIRHRFEFPGSPNEQYGSIEVLEGGQWQNLTDGSYTGTNWLQFMTQNQDQNYVFSGSSGGWITSSYPLDPSKNPGLNAYRLVTESVKDTTAEWEIDYFEIYAPEQHSASPINLFFSKGFAELSNKVSVEITNTGRQVLYGLNLTIEDSSGTAILQQTNIKTNIPFLQKAKILLSDSLKLQPGWNRLTIYTSRPNQRNDQLGTDDTLKLEIYISDSINSDPYCTDFETDGEFSPFTGQGSLDTLWQHTSPGKNTLQGAHSGNLAWITGETGNYPSLASSNLYSGEFNLKAQTCYRLEFWHWYDTEFNYDGGLVEITLDGGQSWNVLGRYADTTWYNTPFVQALGAVNPGFTGNSGGWNYSFSEFQSFYDTVARLRFRFASGGSINKEGWMIDDVCIEEISGSCNQVGLRENILMHSESLVIFPNPASDIATLFIHQNLNASEPMTVEIFNTLGMMIKQMLVEPARNNQYDISLSDLPAGSYLVKASSKSAGYQGVLIKSGN